MMFYSDFYTRDLQTLEGGVVQCDNPGVGGGAEVVKMGGTSGSRGWMLSQVEKQGV